MTLKAGDVVLFKRTFTIEDVQLFTKLSCDEGVHHVTPDEQGRFVIQGLLTATLPTKVGGDLNVLARKMSYEFIKPVYTGETIVCKVTIEQFEKKNNKIYITTSFVCTNQEEVKVMTGGFSGVILLAE